ncbi:MAG: response regulator [Chloroflexi bacterium]|nr:response regulator [Chloroflexota bacterium]MBU1659871.1 response regulator [Chloroflexota bacterium]
MAEKIYNILIVEDDVDVAEMLEAYFRVQGYDVSTVNWGEDAIKACRNKRPDLFILDIRLPDIDGYEVARRLRSNRRTEYIPIIFLTEKRAQSDRLQGLELGADDYITKPFDIQELRLRVRNALRRSTQGAINNPVTGFPEGVLVDERLTDCLGSSDWALLLVSLKNLDGFREDYGFVASDDVIRAVSLMVHNAVRNIGNASDFVGHLSATDFVVVTRLDTISNLKERIQTRLEQSLDYFYPLRDREISQEPRARLALQMSNLLPPQGPFEDIDNLKTALFKQRC